MKYFKVKYSTPDDKERSGIFHSTDEYTLERKLDREYSLWTILSIEEIGGEKIIDAANKFNILTHD
jgi:hypothetical protein